MCVMSVAIGWKIQAPMCIGREEGRGTCSSGFETFLATASRQYARAEQ